MTPAFPLHEIAQNSSLLIVDCLVEGTLIALFAGLIEVLARRQNSGTRFALWFSALIAIAALPLFNSAWWSRATGITAQSIRPAITVPGSWALYLFAAWALIAAWSLVGVARSLRRLHILRQSCTPVDWAMLNPQLQMTLASNRARSVSLCTSDQIHVPTAIGLFNPAVVVPHWVMQELSPDELNQILVHELAHLRRWDDWTNLAQKVVKALFFFHPAVWWIERRVSLEREMACDDAVLAETASPRAYAECLAHLAEKTLIRRSVALAQAALGRIRQTSLRVAQILDVNRPNATVRAWKPAVSLVAGFAIACVFCLSRAPRLIAFDDGNSVRSPAPIFADDSPNIGTGLQAKFNPGQTHPGISRSYRGAAQSPALETRSLNRRIGSSSDVQRVNTRLTDANSAPVAFTETLFVIVEDSGDRFSDQPVLQIQLWRVTVLHPAVNSDNRIPPKQT